MAQNLFNSVKYTRPKKSVFDLSHDVKLSCNMGELIPTMLMECVPSDKVKLGCESLLRFAPLVAPMMHRVDVSMHYFFVPSRLLWLHWEKFITNTPLTEGGALPAFPTLDLEDTHTQNGSLPDYMGIPLLDSPNTATVNAMPFAAYQMVYNEYYRDQNLQDEVDFALLDGDNTPNIASLLQKRKRAWEHDYFTACLPFAQKGEAVTIPIVGFQDVPVWRNEGIPPVPAATTLTGAPSSIVVTTQDAEPGSPVAPEQLFAETSELDAQSATINDLRRAFKLQEWLEKAARGGSRYFESILSFFGLRSPDSRLQRPEYITGTKSPVQISEVLNSTGTAEAPQGSMAGHGVSVTQGKYGNYTCQEHGYIIGIMSIMPKTAYQDGLHRMWSKTVDPFQYYFPQFDHIGEQEVLQKEVFLGTLTPNATFGYVPRYAEYKFLNSRVAGDFRTTLDFWHMGRKFSIDPTLNSDFIECDATHRIFAVTNPEEQKLWCHIYHKVVAIRPMSKFSTPTF